MRMSACAGRMRASVFTLAIALAAPAAATAQASDSAAVIGAAETLLRAISTRDTALARTVFLPGAQIIAVSNPARPGAPRQQADTTFYRTLPQGTDQLLERMWSPVVSLYGTVATVATPYDFHINGKFSHCGVDVFTLVRAGDKWKVSAITYTVQPAGCAPSPLGPPR
jgi:hypothetical protein